MKHKPQGAGTLILAGTLNTAILLFASLFVTKWIVYRSLSDALGDLRRAWHNAPVLLVLAWVGISAFGETIQALISCYNEKRNTARRQGGD